MFDRKSSEKPIDDIKQRFSPSFVIGVLALFVLSAIYGHMPSACAVVIILAYGIVGWYILSWLRIPDRRGTTFDAVLWFLPWGLLMLVKQPDIVPIGALILYVTMTVLRMEDYKGSIFAPKTRKDHAWFVTILVALAGTILILSLNHKFH